MRQTLQSSAVTAPHPVGSTTWVGRFLPRVALIGLLLWALCLRVGAQTPYPTDSYSLSPDGTTLSKWNGNETEIDLSADPAFDNVTTIGPWAFSYKKSLERVTLSSKVEKLDKAAFSDCSALSEIVLSSSLKTVAYKAFFRCGKLTELSLPLGVESLGELAFGQCTALETLILPSSLKEIGVQTFFKCSALRNITCMAEVPPTATANAFDEDCCANAQLSVPESAVETYKATAPWSNFVNIVALQGGGYPKASYELSADKTTLVKWTGAESDIDLTQDKAFGALKTIGSEAFKGLATLASIVIPEGVEKIEMESFEGCTKLTVLQLPTTLKTLGPSAFKGCTSLLEVTLPEGVTALPASAFEECGSLVSIHFSDRMTVVGNRALASCKALRTLFLPGSVSYIDQGAFIDCDALRTIFCYAVTPPTTNQGIFSPTTCSKGILVVPAPTVASYKEATPWKEFIHIDGIQSAYPESSYKLSDDKRTLIRWSGSEATINMAADPAFANLLTIGENAFYEAEDLVSITLPYGVTTLEKQIFVNCPKLTQVTLPAEITKIGEWTFSGCNALESIQLPERMTTLEKCLFAHCKALKEVTLPAGLTTIGSKAFFECSELATIALPSSLISIGEWAFARCSKLTAVEIPGAVTTIETSAFAECPALRSVTLSDQLSTLGDWALSHCTSLTEIVLPASLASIGRHAFTETPLTKITVMRSEPATTTEKFVDQSVYTTALLYVPEDAVDKYKTTAPWSSFQHIQARVVINYPAESYQLSDDKTTLIKWLGAETEIDLSADEAFAKVTTIGPKAFEKKAITSIVLPNTVTKIDDEAFSECASLSSVTLSGALTEIGQWGFYKCVSLEHLALPSSLRRIGKWAFFKCDKLTDVKLPDGLESLGYKAYSGCTAIKEIAIPNSVKEIDIWVFEKCTSLERATFGEDVPTTGTWTFSGCTALTEVVLPKHIDKIGEATFYNCRKLPTIEIPASVKEIENMAFSGCESFTTVVLPSEVKGIANKAFASCSSLSSITIPSKTSWIGDEAFKACLVLDSVICNAVKPPLCGNAPFESVTYERAFLKVPESASELYKKSLPWSNFKKTTAIESPLTTNDSDLQIVLDGGRLLVTGATSVQVYSMEGLLLESSSRMQAGETFMVNLPQGIYLVSADRTSSVVAMP